VVERKVPGHGVSVKIKPEREKEGNMFKKMTVVLCAALALAINSMADVDTTAMDLIKSDAETWISYGVSAAIGMIGLGLGYVGARWAYRKIKGGISAA
jgi:hypothetical protein